MWQLPLIANVCLLPAYLRYFSTNTKCANPNEENMRLPRLSSLASVAATVAATNLYVSSYSGNITTLQLNALPQGGYSLVSEAFNEGSAPSPSWLTENHCSSLLFCIDEGNGVPNGSIASYRTSLDGTLNLLDRVTTLGGPVSGVLFNGGSGLAAAFYGAASVGSLAVNPNGTLTPASTFTFTLSTPGPDPARQSAPYPHEVILDPTGTFIIAPDLGADLLRVFAISPSSSALTPSTPYPVIPGSGPRHGAFLKTSRGTTYLFVITELSNTITSYAVTYNPNTTLSFTPVFTSSTYGPRSPPPGAAGAEVLVSPDGNYLLTSSRNDSLFAIPNFNPANATRIPSDSLQVWAIDHATGKLAFLQLAPAGGSYPRQFSLNRNGTLAAVGLQMDGRVVVMERNANGTFGGFVGSVDVEGEITSVVWDE